MVEAANGTAIRGAKISFVHDGKAVKSIAQTIVKKTAVKGGLSLKSLPAGIYNVSISKNGYREQLVMLAVSDGERSELKVKLEKN